MMNDAPLLLRDITGMDDNKDSKSGGNQQVMTKYSHMNNLEGSISLTERTAKKYVPIYKELLKVIGTFEK